MSNKDDHVTIQAVLVADNYSDEFVPITNDIPLVLWYNFKILHEINFIHF